MPCPTAACSLTCGCLSTLPAWTTPVERDVDAPDFAVFLPADFFLLAVFMVNTPCAAQMFPALVSIACRCAASHRALRALRFLAVVFFARRTRPAFLAPAVERPVVFLARDFFAPAFFLRDVFLAPGFAGFFFFFLLGSIMRSRKL